MDIKIKTYDEFINDHKKYDGTHKCFIPGCDKPAYYEGGDSRFYCGMCEEHAEMKEYYRVYLRGIRRTIRIRMLWDKDDTTLVSLYNDVLYKFNV